MKIINSDEDSVTLRLSVREFTDIISAISSVRNEYKSLDHTFLNVPLDRVRDIGDQLAEGLVEFNKRNQERDK